MTADIDHYTKTETGADAELSGLVLVVGLLAVLMVLALLFS
jgi:hypothetical protein